MERQILRFRVDGRRRLLYQLRGEVAEEVDDQGADELREVGSAVLGAGVGVYGVAEGFEGDPEPAGARDGYGYCVVGWVVCC